MSFLLRAAAVAALVVTTTSGASADSGKVSVDVNATQSNAGATVTPSVKVEGNLGGGVTGHVGVAQPTHFPSGGGSPSTQTTVGAGISIPF